MLHIENSEASSFPSMYEQLMDLALFKGVGKSHISLFLEKTPVCFPRFKAGSPIRIPKEKTSSLLFIISGTVQRILPLTDRLSLKETIRKGNVVGADTLFGLSTDFAYTYIALEETIAMEFSKEHYLALLESERIFLINFLNYLSSLHQKQFQRIRKPYAGESGFPLRLKISLLAHPKSQEATLCGNLHDISQWAGYSKSDLEEELNLLEQLGMTTLLPDGIVFHALDE